MGRCRCCQTNARTISETIGFCYQCIRERFDEVWPAVKAVHDRSRSAYGLPTDPPRSSDGRTCPLCVHRCRISEGDSGYCGLRQVKSSVIRGGRPHEGNLSYYFDPLPTNCVGGFVCPAGTNSGYPRHSMTDGPEYGYKNLAVFYHACSFNCLYCQNYHYRSKTRSKQTVPARKLAGVVDTQTACICYFGGDPTPQVLHALKTSKLARERTSNPVLRICWETNGTAREPFITMMARESFESGGCIKFDLKAWDPAVHYALTGVTNKQTLKNFKKLAGWSKQRPDPPFLIASTLLVPGYVDEDEVGAIASFLAGLNPDIPYSLLAFYPTFFLRDLPATARSHALRCKNAAEAAGLRRVHLGNLHLLGPDY